jgi:hypothetical protein
MYSPVGRAKLSAATKRLMETGDLRNPTSLPERLKPQMVSIVPVRFFKRQWRTKVSWEGMTGFCTGNLPWQHANKH